MRNPANYTNCKLISVSSRELTRMATARTFERKVAPCSGLAGNGSVPGQVEDAVYDQEQKLTYIDQPQTLYNASLVIKPVTIECYTPLRAGQRKVHVHGFLTPAEHSHHISTHL
jgi:hypothetical protein